MPFIFSIKSFLYIICPKIVKKVHSNFFELMVTSSNFYVLSGQDIQFTVMYDTEKKLEILKFFAFFLFKKD